MTLRYPILRLISDQKARWVAILRCLHIVLQLEKVGHVLRDVMALYITRKVIYKTVIPRKFSGLMHLSHCQLPFAMAMILIFLCLTLHFH